MKREIGKVEQQRCERTNHRVEMRQEKEEEEEVKSEEGEQ